MNLKAVLSTSNGDSFEPVDGKTEVDIRPRQGRHLPCRNDQGGSPWLSETGNNGRGIMWLVADSMWEYFGGAGSTPARWCCAGPQPLDFTAYPTQIKAAALRVRRLLSLYELPGEGIDWDRLLAKYP